MRNVTDEEIVAWEKELLRQDNLLVEHSWRQVEGGWLSPDDVFHSYASAYDHLMDRLMIQGGWKRILHVDEITFGLHEGDISERGMRQSPHTKRLYNFLEAVAIFEGNILESEFPEGLCRFSASLNQALSDFSADTIYTQTVKENGKLLKKIKDGPVLYELR